MTVDVSEDGVRRTAHVQSVLDSLKERSFIYGTILSTIQLTSVTKGAAITRLTLDDTHVNSKGGLHGAVSATIVDFTTGLAIASWDLRETTGASVDMHLTYVGTAGKGDLVEITSVAEKVGGNMAFVTVKIEKLVSETERKPVTLAQHTKFVRGTAPATTTS